MGYFRSMGDAVTDAAATGVAAGAALSPTYTSATRCSEIPAGDPYRQPPNQCTGNDGTIKTFDRSGNVPTSSSSGLGAYAVVAGVALAVMLLGGGR